jgi:hypothetical protein
MTLLRPSVAKALQERKPPSSLKVAQLCTMLEPKRFVNRDIGETLAGRWRDIGGFISPGAP